ncbi:unnamed protein product [Sympodiomycopsis kandeliae]
MNGSRVPPLQQGQPSSSRIGIASSSGSGLGARRLGNATSSSASLASGSRFGYRGASTSGATPLGKRTVSNTSIEHDIPSSSFSSKQRTTSGDRPPTPSSSQQFSTLKNEYETRLLLSEQKYESLESSHKKLITDHERSQSELRKLKSLYDQLQAEHKRDQHASEQEIEKLCQQKSELRKEAAEREEDLQTIIEDADHERRESHTEKKRLEGQVIQLTSERDELHERVKSSDQQRQVQEERIRHLEEQLEQQQQQQRRQQQSSSSSSEKHAGLDAELHRILTHSRQVASLEKANESLTKKAQGVAVLQEENASLRKKVEVLDRLQEEVAALQARDEERSEEIQAWERSLSSSSSSPSTKLEADAAMQSSDLTLPLPSLPSPPLPLTRSSLPSYVSNLRGLLSGLLTRSHILSTKLDSSESERQQREQTLAAMQKKIQQSEEEIRTWKDRQVEFTTYKSQCEEEIRRYRDLLKSYELQQQQQQQSTGEHLKTEQSQQPQQESDGDTSMTAAESSSSDVKRLLERIALLESDLSSKDADLSRLTSSHTAELSAIQSLLDTERDSLSAVRDSLISLQKENTTLNTQLCTAQERLGLGEFNVEKYNCLVLKRNPVDLDRDLRTKTMDRLKTENLKLVRQLEKGKEGVPMETVENLRLEVKGLLESIKVKDKAMLRLKQVYTQKATEFRSAIQSLFGFKVRFLESGQVRLNSTFSRSSKSTSLLFKSDSNNLGSMKLSGEAAQDNSLANIPHLRDYWLSGGNLRQSVPCFLAALQLELYESTTQAVRGAWSVPDQGKEEEEEEEE